MKPSAKKKSKYRIKNKHGRPGMIDIANEVFSKQKIYGKNMPLHITNANLTDEIAKKLIAAGHEDELAPASSLITREETDPPAKTTPRQTDPPAALEPRKNDPPFYLYRKGKQVLSAYHFLNEAGFIERIKNRFGVTIKPTHNFELLKSVRQKLFEEAEKKFIAKQKSDELETTYLEIKSLYLKWLRKELKVIAGWLSDKYANGQPKKRLSDSKQIELLKYQAFVNAEIELLKKSLRTAD